jgi:hypothetical protein
VGLVRRAPPRQVKKAAQVMTKLGLDQPDARKVVVIDASPKASASKV